MSMDINYKQAECISDDYKGLTKGNIYYVNYEFDDYVVVKNDIGYTKKYPCEIFRIIEVKNKNYKIKPTYYGSGIDVIEFCLRNNLTFMQGNVIKYVTRYKDKNGIEDLEKAKEYIDRLIEFEKRSEK